MVLWSSRMRLAAFLVLYLASLLGTGIGVGIGNHPLQIPLIQSLSMPGFLAGDPFVATLPSYASPLWHLVALPARLLPWEPLLVVLFLLERAFVLYAFGRLAGALAARGAEAALPPQPIAGGSEPFEGSESKVRVMAVVAGWAFAALTPRPLVGDGTMVANYFEHTGVAIALIALSAAALVERRVWRFGLLLGLAFDCNILYGIFAVGYFVPMIWLQRRQLPLQQAARGLALALLLALPAVFMVVAGRGGATSDAAGWVAVLRAYYPEHFFPATWEPAALWRLGLLVISIVALALVERRRQPESSWRLLAWTAVFGFWLALSAVNARFLPIPQLFILHPARGGDPGMVLLILGAIAALVVGVETAASRAPRLIAGAALIGSPLLFFGWSARAAVMAALVTVGLELGRERMARARAWLADTPRIAPAIVVGTMVASVVAFNVSLLARSGRLMRGPEPEERAFAGWARGQSPPDAVFLVDPNWNMFRSLAERQPFVTWKEGAAMLWRQDFVDGWRQRLGALGGHFEGAGTSSLDLTASYDHLSDAEVRALAARHRIDFWIARRDQSTALPVVYTAGDFKVLAVGSRT